MKIASFSLLLILITSLLSSCKEVDKKKEWTKSKLLFEDSGSNNWTNKWILDGKKGIVINSKKGMELIAGDEYANDSCHTVLWTKKDFKGNICIEYDYTKLDTTTRCVNILYFHAEGKGDLEFPKDISKWNEKRTVPYMKTYFNNMNTYHISYAAFSAKEYSKDNDYIRLRRYNANSKGLGGTDIPKDYFKTGLFKTNVTYSIKVIRYKDTVEMHIQNKTNETKTLICKWDASIYSLYKSGRIGLRHMYTRNARYKNFKVWQIE